ncbi:MAG: hypothetical protein ACFFDN_38740, partial [Candidatus Hodarchaeota archaeon]
SWNIFYTSYNGTMWTDEKSITDSPGGWGVGSMVIGQNNIAHFLWYDEIASDQYYWYYELYYRSYDIDNNLWSEQELIPLHDLIVVKPFFNMYFSPIYQSITVGPDKTVHITWSDAISGNPEIYYISKDENGWSPKKRLTIAPEHSVLPNILITHDNKIFIFWSDFRDGNFEIYYKYSELVLINTAIGTNVDVTDPITGITLTFENVTSCGYTNITIIDTGPAPPKEFKIVPLNVYYNITTTASYTGTITIAIPYDESQIKGPEFNLELRHWNPESEEWEDVTTWIDTEKNIIYGEVTSLSIFAVMLPAVFLDLENLKQIVIDSPDSAWRQPAENRKNTMIEKIDEAIVLCQNEEYDECYNKMFHDIKPKLTGLKIDEEGNPFGNGVFNNPWVIDQNLQQEFGEQTDLILILLKSKF